MFEAQIKTLHQTGLWTQIAGYFLGTALPGFVIAEGGNEGFQIDRLAARNKKKPLVSGFSGGGKKGLFLQRIANFAQQHDIFRRRRGCFRRCCFRGTQAVHLLDHHENDEGEDDEIDQDGQK